MMLLLFVVKSIQAETEVPTLYNLHSVFKMNLTVKERSRTPKNCFIIACPCGGWIPLFGILIQGVEQFLKKIFVRRRRTMKWHQINTKTRRNSRPHSADKKHIKKKLQLRSAPGQFLSWSQHFDYQGVAGSVVLPLNCIVLHN